MARRKGAAKRWTVRLEKPGVSWLLRVDLCTGDRMLAACLGLLNEQPLSASTRGALNLTSQVAGSLTVCKSCRRAIRSAPRRASSRERLVFEARQHRAGCCPRGRKLWRALRRRQP